MKKIITTLLISLFAIGCNSNFDENIDFSENEKIVSISLTNRFIEYDEPLNKTRAVGGNDLYGFQIWANENGRESIDNPKYSYDKNTNGSTQAIPVCCGLFDNLEDIKIELSTKYTYNIEMAYVPNGKNLVYRHSSGSYEAPFNMHNWTPTPINKIIYTEKDWMYQLGQGSVNGSDNSNRQDGIYRLGVDLFYGQVLNIVPKSDGIISIDLKDMIWGLTLRAKKVEGKTYDKLVIKLNIGSMWTRDFHMTIDPNKEVSELVIPKILLNTSYSYSHYLDSNYSDKTRITIGTDDKPSDIISTEISIKRNVMKIIEFDATNEKYDNGVDVVIDDEGMKNEIEYL